MTKFDHVVARFNGADLTFRIARADLELFERLFKPAFEAFKDLSSGRWRISDVKDTLAFALLPPSQIERLRKTTERATQCRIASRDLIAMMEGRPTAKETILTSPVIDAAFDKGPPGNYVPLAQAVLAAALFGIEEADAKFTDEPADGQG